MVNGVLANTVKAMNCHVEHVWAWIGPAISAKNYEVGGAVRTAFIAAFGEDARACFAYSRDSEAGAHYLCDLYALAKLHLLQMMPTWVIPAERRDALYAVLIGYLDDRKGKKFVRAWAYNGLAVLADQYPELRGDVLGLLARGREEEASSVKARIRNLSKEFEWV